MSLWRELTRGLARLRHRRAADQDAADEVHDYLERATAEHRARGLGPAAAHRAATLEMGSATAATEAVRGFGWERGVEALVSDLRYAVRRLRGEPGFTVVTILTLALGIGASTAIVSALGPVLLQSLPYPDANRILAVWDLGDDGGRVDVTYNTQQELRARATAFEALAVYRPWQPTLTSAAEPERLEGHRVSWDYLRVLGVAPALGADFTASHDRPGGPGPVILSDALWRRRFGADPAIIGRPVTLGDASHVVAGVMPANFTDVLGPVEIWTPLQYAPTEGRAWGHHLRMIGRLRPGVAVDQARRELAGIATNPVAEFPRAEWAALEHGLLALPLQADLTRSIRPAMLAIAGAVALVLIIACVNVTNLLLARGARRHGEFVLRAALGAGVGRLVRQSITESVFLAALGGAAGLGLAVLGVRALVAVSPPGLPRVDAITLSGSMLTFGIVLTAVVGVVLGLIPARAARRSARAPGARHVTGGHHRTRAALIVTQVALALVLLVCSGLLLRSMQRLFDVELGFESAGLLTMQVQATGQRFQDDATTDRFFAEVQEAVRLLPGVSAVAMTSQLPLSGDLDMYGAKLEPAPETDPGEDRGIFRYTVSPDYFGAMRISLLQGRLLGGDDREGTARVAVVSESFAKRRLPGTDPLGRQMRIGGREERFTIVGVVADVRQVSPAATDADAVYITPGHWGVADQVMSLVVRGRSAPQVLAAQVRRAVWSVDRNQPIVRVISMDDLVAASAAERRFALIIFQAFALAALALATAGLYGVMAGSVAERTRELGVRSALGATPQRILGLIIRESLRLTGIGVAIGFVAATAASRGLAAMLFGVSPLDPVTYVSVVALLAVVALVAAAAPAWRAASVSPVTPLRAE